MYPMYLLLIAAALLAAGAASNPEARLPGRVGEVLHEEEFDGGLSKWTAELQKGGRVEAADGRMVIDVPGGCTV